MAVAFLQTLDPQDRSALMALGHHRRFRRGAPLIVQGDHSDRIFVLLRGRAKVTVDTLDGHEIVLAVLRSGDLAGEFEALDHDGGPRTASTVAAEPVECQVLTGDEFRSFLDSHPRAVRVVLEIIVQRLRAADRRRIDSGTLDTAHRLARLFIELVDQRDPADVPTIDLDIPLTQHELATLIATSRESLVRALTVMRARGLISTARRRISVCDLDGLRRYSQ